MAEAATCTTHNKHKGRKSSPSTVFEPVIPAIKRLQNYAYGQRDGPFINYFQTLSRQVYHNIFFYSAGHSISYKTSKSVNLTQFSRYLFQLLIYISWLQFHFNIQQFCVILNLQPLLILSDDSAKLFGSLKFPLAYFNSTYAYCTKWLLRTPHL